MREIKIPRHEQYKGATYTYSVDLALIEQSLGLTVSSATWSTQDSAVTIGTASLAASVASAPVTAASKGDSLVKLTLSTSGDDAPVFYFSINVLDPEN